MNTTALARQLRALKNEAEYRTALISAGAETASAAMCATEARIEGFSGLLATSHAAYCLKDAAALARDAGHAAGQLKRIGRPPITDGDPREKKSITLRRSTWERLEEKRQPGESLAACIDRLLSEGKFEAER